MEGGEGRRRRRQRKLLPLTNLRATNLFRRQAPVPPRQQGPPRDLLPEHRAVPPDQGVLRPPEQAAGGEVGRPLRGRAAGLPVHDGGQGEPEAGLPLPALKSGGRGGEGWSHGRTD